MINILKQVCKERILTAIYTDKNNYDRFSVGYVMELTKERFLMKHLTTRGEFDGYSVKNIDDVYRIEVDGMYLEKIKTLCLYKEELDKFPEIDIKEDLLYSIIDYAIDNKLISVICLDEEAGDVFGYISSYNHDSIEVMQVSEYGQDDGKTMFLLGEIIKISVNDTECMDLDLLHKHLSVTKTPY